MKLHVLFIGAEEGKQWVPLWGKNRAISKKKTLFDVERCKEAFQKTCLSFGGSLEGSNWCTAGGERKGTGFSKIFPCGGLFFRLAKYLDSMKPPLSWTPDRHKD